MPYPLPVKKSSLNKYSTLTIVLIALAFLAGCAAGPNAETRTINQVTDGVEGQSEAIKVRNFTLVTGEDGSGVVVATLVNQDEASDEVLAITINGQQANLGYLGKSATSLALTNRTPLTFSGPSANAYAYITELGAKAGYRVPVRVELAKSGVINLDVLIREQSGDFAQVTIPESATR